MELQEKVVKRNTILKSALFKNIKINFSVHSKVVALDIVYNFTDNAIFSAMVFISSFSFIFPDSFISYITLLKSFFIK
jgi:hypothetical protein